MRKFVGFTLAEVLITLGIIGVVAALTLPSVIQKYQKKVTAERLKKMYSTLSQAVQMSEKDNDSVETWDFLLPTQDFMNKYIVPYIKDIAEREKSGNNLSKEYILADGSTLYAWTYHYSQDGYKQCVFRQFNVDINGDKKPNVLGKDIFIFYVFPKKAGFYNGGTGDIAQNVPHGGLYPDGYGYLRDTMKNDSWRGCNRRGDTVLNGDVEVDNLGGAFCTALIMYDGWEIKNDYNW